MNEAEEAQELIMRCHRYALSRDYCWFRISFAKIGDAAPHTWVAWFEYAGLGNLNYRCDHTQGSDTLLGALQKLTKAVGI
jgi:hypothetical protein